MLLADSFGVGARLLNFSVV